MGAHDFLHPNQATPSTEHAEAIGATVLLHPMFRRSKPSAIQNDLRENLKSLRHARVSIFLLESSPHVPQQALGHDCIVENPSESTRRPSLIARLGLTHDYQLSYEQQEVSGGAQHPS